MKLLCGKISVIWHRVPVESQSRELRIANTLEGKAFPGNAGDVSAKHEVLILRFLFLHCYKLWLLGFWLSWVDASFSEKGLEGTSLTLSPILCPGAEEFVVVILKMLAGQETSFPPCANDVFSHVPTICSFCCAVACLKAVGQAGFSLPSPGHSNRWRSWVVTLLHHCLDCLCTGSGLCQDNFLASFGLDQTQKIGLQTLT